ncbi:MgtC/SapB family protein [Tepidamorphus sp. 3E244]|uniref:MgtC/SapB family protein n=1 Tax=Tepidamorphus sp. 3E244 TaxID=3385498 RepID=UPI0038FC83E3
MPVSSFSELTEMNSLSTAGVVTVRLGLAALTGAVVGFEREMRDRSAGLRTHMLISVASAAFAIIAISLFHAVSDENGANADPIRLIEAVTAGVAFLAAGAIIREKERIRGLTSGANMWMAGAIGVACGTGFYVLAGIATVIVLIIMIVVRGVEKRFL